MFLAIRSETPIKIMFVMSIAWLIYGIIHIIKDKQLFRNDNMIIFQLDADSIPTLIEQECRFYDLFPSSTFTINGDTYMKIADNSDINFNAVDMFTGHLVYFDDDVIVKFETYE